jgi:hypothetical protein
VHVHDDALKLSEVTFLHITALCHTVQCSVALLLVQSVLHAPCQANHQNNVRNVSQPSLVLQEGIVMKPFVDSREGTSN